MATTKSQSLYFGLFDQENWGLVIYDEEHLLPAPILEPSPDFKPDVGWG